MPGPTTSLDTAVKNADAAYTNLHEPLPTLVAHLESLDPAFARVPTVGALRELVRAHVDRTLAARAESTPGSALTQDAYLSALEGRVRAETGSVEWDALVDEATRVVQQTHDQCEPVQGTPLATAPVPVPGTMTTDSVMAVNVLQLDTSFNLWSPDSQLGDGSDYEFHQNQSAARREEEDTERAMHVFELYAQKQEMGDSGHAGRDAGSSDSTLFPEYHGETSLDEATPVPPSSGSRAVTAADALGSAAKVLKAHPDWLLQHPHWKAVTSALVRATAVTVTSNGGDGEEEHDAAATAPPAPSSTLLLVDYFRATGPAQRYLALTELCCTVRGHTVDSTVTTLVPVVLELARQTPDDWLTWLESEVLQGLQHLIDDVVLAFPDHCARADPTAEWLAQWATRPALAISVAALLTERPDLLARLAQTLLESANEHIACVVAYLLPMLATSNSAKRRESEHGKIVAQLCDAVVAFALRRGLPPACPRATPLAANTDDPVYVCTASMAQLLRAVPRTQLPGIGHWCQETLRIVELQLDGGVPEATTVRLLSLLLQHVDTSETDGREVVGRLDTRVASKMARCDSAALRRAAHDLWCHVLPHHWSVLPSVCDGILAAVVAQCEGRASDTHDGAEPLPGVCDVYSIHHLIVISDEVRGWAWLSEKLSTSALCAGSPHALAHFARLLLRSLAYGATAAAATADKAACDGASGAVPQLTRQTVRRLHRWCAGVSEALPRALLHEARRWQLASSTRLYAGDGADTSASLTQLAAWPLTVPAELVACEPLETSTARQALLDAAVLDQALSLLLQFGIEATRDKATAPLTDTACDCLLQQYSALTVPGTQPPQTSASHPALALPFGVESRALLLRLAVVCHLTHPAQPLTAAALAVEAGSGGADSGVDVESILRRVLCAAEALPSSAVWLAPLLLSGFNADVDEDALMESLASAPIPSSPPGTDMLSPDQLGDPATELCASVFAVDGSAPEQSGLLRACALAWTAFGDSQQVALVLSRQPAHVWATALDLRRRVFAVVVRVVDMNPFAAAVLSTAGVDVFALCHVHTHHVLVRHAEACLSAAAANGVPGLEDYLTASFSSLLQEVTAPGAAARQQAWCLPESSLLPLPPPFFISILASMR